MRRILAISSALFLVTLGCTKKESPTANPTTAEKKFRVGLVLDKGGKDDKSFNSAAFAGATKAVKELGIELKDVESPDDSAFEPALRSFAEKGMDLVIAIGFSQHDAMARVAPQFPNVKFAIVDAEVTGPNVANLLFAEHEGSYLVGYLAGLASKTGTLGFIGGMDIPLIHRFELGYEEGVKAANPKAKVLINYAGITSEAWANPSRGKELALGQIANGADIIFHAAGATGMGVFDAVEEKGKLAIGVDSNQNWVKPGKILTSMLKRVDTAVFYTIYRTMKNQFEAGTHSYGLADSGVDYAVDDNNAKLIEPYKAKVEEVKSKIIAGQVKVSDYYVVRKTK
jgi:basic membrane protein A